MKESSRNTNNDGDSGQHEALPQCTKHTLLLSGMLLMEVGKMIPGNSYSTCGCVYTVLQSSQVGVSQRFTQRVGRKPSREKR